MLVCVREQFAKNQLQKLTSKDIKVLLDPTLLLDKEVWWKCFAINSSYALKKEKYIVTYFVGAEKKKYRSIVAEYAKKFKLPVWTIQYSNYYWKESNKKILGASIIDFIALIANAELVITDSFHGAAFSINMGTNFVSLTNLDNPVRVKEFLSQFNLNNRIDMIPSNYSPIEYKKVYNQLEKLRRDSIEWILNAINE